jgi:hypothetical protein
VTDPSESPAPLTRREARALERAAEAAAAGVAARSAATRSVAAGAVAEPGSSSPAVPSSSVSGLEPVVPSVLEPVEPPAVTPAVVAPAVVAPAVVAPAVPSAEQRTVTTRHPVSVPRGEGTGRPAPRLRQAPPRRSLASASTPVAAAPASSRRSASTVLRRVRETALPALALVAVTLFFSSNVTPATATELGGSGVQTSATAPLPGQTLAASLVVLTVDDRDGFGVTDPPPPPPPPVEVAADTSTPTNGGTAAGASAGASSRSAASGAGTIVNSGTGDIRWPFPGTVVLSSGFGPRAAPCAACSSMHMGLDMTPGGGTPIGAVASGTVRTSGLHAQFGQYVVIDHVIDGKKISTLYAHMQLGSSPLVAGQAVGVGELVGKVGRTGVATGEHLHFEVLVGGSTQVDPKAWLDANAGRTL